MFLTRHRKNFLSQEEIDIVLNCIRENEQNTSGEIRLYIETHCSYVDPVQRAKEIFLQLKMYETPQRNAVLIYIAHQDRDFALFSDGALFKVAPHAFWKKESDRLAAHFYQKNYLKGLLECIAHVGEQLRNYFPSKGETKNELPDEIIFGK
jgi:uncharacterized membrane protein